MQCLTRVESYAMGSHTSSFINKSAENLLWTWRKKQSPLLILIIGEGKTYLFQVWTSSSLQLLSLISTALHISLAVLKRRFEPKRLNAGFFAFSRFMLISMKATALHVTGQSWNAAFNQDDCLPSLLAVLCIVSNLVDEFLRHFRSDHGMSSGGYTFLSR